MLKFVIFYLITIIAFVAQSVYAIPAIISGKDNSCNCGMCWNIEIFQFLSSFRERKIEKKLN